MQIPVIRFFVHLLCLCTVSRGHVGLTYPPARKFDLDFLDNIRTKPPCGMPKGSLRTSLRAGSTVNVTWHLSYPHRGGYKLEVLNKDDEVLMDLTSNALNDNYISGDPTAQSQLVKIPNSLTCDDCTLRLVRQASEWANNYRFFSCADVSIVRPYEYVETCNGHGTPHTRGCSCQWGFWGSHCQYEDECETNSDCGSGKCIHLGGTALPARQCFCPHGFHGEKWLKSKEKEIEFVLVVNGTSYGALGWRPSELDKTCKQWPFITATHPGDSDDEAHSEPEPETGAKPGYKKHFGEKSGKPEPEPESDTKSIRDGNRRSHPAAEPEPEGEVEPESEPGYRTKGTKATSEPEPEYTKSGSQSKSAKPGYSTAEPEPEYSASGKLGKHQAGSRKPGHPATAEPEPEYTKSSSQFSKSTRPGYSTAEPEPEYTAANVKGGKPGSKKPGHPATPVPEPESAAEAEPEGEPVKNYNRRKQDKNHPAISEPEPTSKSTTKNRPHAQPEPTAESEPRPSSHPATSGTGTKRYGPTYRPKAGSSAAEPEYEPNTRTGSGGSRTSGKTKKHPSVAEPEPETISEPEPEPDCEYKPLLKARSRTNSPRAEPRPRYKENESLLRPVRETRGNLRNRGWSPATPNPEPETEPESYPEEPSDKKGLSSTHPIQLDKHLKYSSYAPKGDFHSMDCVDLVMGAARGMYSRIRDYYTRDRSTPRLDTFWGGHDDITSATGWETNEQTVLIFRRRLQAVDAADHSITGEMHVIWARGQEPGEYIHKPHSGLEKDNPSVPYFYAQDEIKYHGHGSQRGVTFIDFSSEPTT